MPLKRSAVFKKGKFAIIEIPSNNPKFPKPSYQIGCLYQKKDQQLDTTYEAEKSFFSVKDLAALNLDDLEALLVDVTSGSNLYRQPVTEAQNAGYVPRSQRNATPTRAVAQVPAQKPVQEDMYSQGDEPPAYDFDDRDIPF